MSGCISPPLPPQKLTEITKHLRSRNISLISLLPFAHKILESQRLKETNIYFPKKEEWLLEWAVQRLREDDNVGASEARCNPEIWRFILRLMPSSTCASLIFKKHNILQVISKTFSEAILFPSSAVAINSDVEIQRGVEEVYTMPQEITSSLISSAPGRGLPPLRKVASNLRELLESVSAVLLYLRKNLAAGGREGNVVTVLRGTPEAGAQILGSYLEACHMLMQGGLELEEDWTNAILGVWRSCIWGNPNSKKMSSLFSTFCLVPIARLISIPSIPSHLRNETERLIAEFIFSSDVILPDSSSGAKSTESLSKDLKLLLQPLKTQKEALPHVFRIGISSQAKKRKLNKDTVETILNSVTSGVLGIESVVGDIANSDAEIIVGILEVLADTSTTVSSETLASYFDLISNLSSSKRVSVRWNIVKVALRLDFDIFLGKGSDERKMRLICALTRARRNEEIVFKVVELLIDCFVKARDLEGFVSFWMQELGKKEARGGIWESDRVAGFFADKIEKALLAAQIDKILRTAYHDENWIVVDAVLRGVRREDTQYTIQGSLLKIAESVSKGDAGWRGWRALVRAVQIDRSLAKSIQRFALAEMRKSVAGTSGDEARQTLFASEALMGSADIDKQSEVLTMVVQAMNSAQRGWDGSVDDIDDKTLGVAMAIGFTTGWLEAVELVSSNVRTQFVDRFLDMAMKEITEGGSSHTISKNLWLDMLARGEFYEYSRLKDAVLAALIAKLEAISDVSGDVNSSLENIRKGKSVLIKQDMCGYGFLLKSIMAYPVEAIKRAARERILDSLVVLDARLEVGRAQGQLRDEVKVVVERLWGLGNARSFLARDAGGFMNWVLGGGDKAGRKILRFVLATKEQERSREFLTNLVELAEASFFHEGRVKLENLNVCEIIVEEFWQAGEEISARRLRHGIMRKIRESIESREINGQLVGVWRRMWILGQDLGVENEALGLAQGIIKSVGTVLPGILSIAGHPGEALGLEEATKIVAETAMLLCACSRVGKELVNTTALVACMLDSLSAGLLRSEIMIAYKRMILDILDPEAYLECLETVADGCFAPRSKKLVPPGYWEVLKILVGGAKKPEDNETSKNVTACLSAVLSKLAQNLPRAKTVDEFLIILDCMDIILREKLWAVMQYNIDETLVSAAITASPSGPSFDLSTVCVDEIVIKLCDLCRVILTLHRRKVRGSRYHLAIAAIKSLLHCIYKCKAPEERKKSDQILHPPWLLPCAPTSTGKTDIRTAKFARITGRSTDSLNRLLTTFCEPTASSVRETARKKTDDSLVNSVRDREKREVASCIGSLLGEILKGILEEGFEGDITASISAILEVLGPEGVKAFSKTVDREGRAMLRELWDEYNRVREGANEKWSLLVDESSTILRTIVSPEIPDSFLYYILRPSESNLVIEYEMAHLGQSINSCHNSMITVEARDKVYQGIFPRLTGNRQWQKSTAGGMTCCFGAAHPEICLWISG